VRIIAGKYRRRVLLTNDGLTTRPITNRVKEMLFQRLEAEIKGKRVADIFAGTGTIGIEAISRGASSVVFFERDRKAIDLLKENIQSIGMDEPHLCWKTDILKTSFCPKGVDDLFPFDVIFFDPPYVMVKDLKPGSELFKALERLAAEQCSSENALLIFRTPSRADFEMPEAWVFDRTYKVSSMEVHLFDKKSVETEE
jgi:16S rRNA (guanine966-N2)-methyltransferase